MILLIFITNLLFASTEMGLLIDSAHQNYLSQADKKIAIFDRDEIGWRFAQAKAYDSENVQSEIVRDYLEERFGFEIDLDHAAFFTPYLAISTSFAGALPIGDLCAVFPPSANSNRRLGHERIIGLENIDQFGTLDYGKLRKRMSGLELRNISLYHEMGHCLDTKLSPMASSHGIHLSEAFAESIAVMLMNLDGHRVAKKRATHRAVYSIMMSPFFVDNPALGMGSESFTYGGQIYYLSPVINEAEKQWRKEKPSTIAEIMELARVVVKEKAIAGRSFQAIYNYFNLDEDVVGMYKKKASEWPEMFEEPYKDLKKYLKETKRYKRRAFGFFSIFRDGDELLPWDMTPFCDAYLQDDKQAFFETLDIYRRNLGAISEDVDGQITRANDLDSIYEIVSRNCVEAS